jgi:hypothetical protein
MEQYTNTAVTVAAPSKAWTVFARLNTGIEGWNPTQGTDVCVYSVCVVLCMYRPWDRLIPHPRSPTNCLRFRNWSETKCFTDALCSKVGATGKRKREREIQVPTSNTTIAHQWMSPSSTSIQCISYNLFCWDPFLIVLYFSIYAFFLQTTFFHKIPL